MKKSVRQLELPLPRPAGAKTPLTPEAAACLAAIKSGIGQMSRVGIAAKLDSGSLAKSIEMLTYLGFVERKGPTRRLALTARARRARIAIVKPDRHNRPSRAPGGSYSRMLDALDEPRGAAAIAAALGITPQRVMQLLLSHISAGTLRVGDPGAPSFIIARADDRRRLLTRHEARALSVLPDHEPSTLGAIAAATHLPRKEVDVLLWALAEAELVIAAARDVWKLSAAGAKHFQRQAARRRAAPVRLPVYSDRVVAVLSALHADGLARAAELAERLSVPRDSMNALMQYLKRRGLARKAGLSALAPHAITALGRETLEAIRRRAALKT